MVDLVVVDGPNLYNTVARFLVKETNQTTAKEYLTTSFDVDRLITATIAPSRPPQVPQLGVVMFHSRRQLGGEKTVKLVDREVTAFWARQGSNPFSSTELVELPGSQAELTEAVCPHCDEKVVCQTCHQPARMEERREKGVDTSITTFLLETADRWQAVCIVSGDADFVPSVRSLKRRGKQVFCAVEPGSGNQDLTQVCTSHFDVNTEFLRQDLKRFELLKPHGILDRELEALQQAGGEVRGIGVTITQSSFHMGVTFRPPVLRQPSTDLETRLTEQLKPANLSAQVSPENSLGPQTQNQGLALRITPTGRVHAETGIPRHFEDITRDAPWRRFATIITGQ